MGHERQRVWSVAAVAWPGAKPRRPSFKELWRVALVELGGVEDKGTSWKGNIKAYDGCTMGSRRGTFFHENVPNNTGAQHHPNHISTSADCKCQARPSRRPTTPPFRRVGPCASRHSFRGHGRCSAPRGSSAVRCTRPAAREGSRAAAARPPRCLPCHPPRMGRQLLDAARRCRRVARGPARRARAAAAAAREPRAAAPQRGAPRPPRARSRRDARRASPAGRSRTRRTFEPRLGCVRSPVWVRSGHGWGAGRERAGVRACARAPPPACQLAHVDAHDLS